MAKTSVNTLTTPQNKLIKEDIADKIINVDPHETPMSALLGYKDVESRTPTWNEDKYRTPNPANKQEPGFKAVSVARTGATPTGNYTQIFSDVVNIDSAMAKSNIYGNFNKPAYIASKVAIELRKDLEAAVTSSQASVAPADGTAGQMAGFGAIVKTNVNKANNGSIAGYQSNGTTTARTKGTARTITEATFKDALNKRFKSTGDANKALTAFTTIELKEAMSGFSGRSIDRNDGDGKTISGAADVYVSNVGTVTIVPHSYINDTDSVLIVDSSKGSVGIFRKYENERLAKDGDSDAHMMILEATLCLDSEKAHAQVVDVKAS